MISVLLSTNHSILCTQFGTHTANRRGRKNGINSINSWQCWRDRRGEMRNSTGPDLFVHNFFLLPLPLFTVRYAIYTLNVCSAFGSLCTIWSASSGSAVLRAVQHCRGCGKIGRASDTTLWNGSASAMSEERCTVCRPCRMRVYRRIHFY